MLSAVKRKYIVRLYSENSENKKNDLCGQSPLVDTEMLIEVNKTADFIRNQPFYWSEWGDSNSRHLEPKSSALPTGPHPDMKLENFSRSGQTCGQKPFQISGFEKSREKSARAATVFRIAVFSGNTGSLSTQIKRPTNWATPGNVDFLFYPALRPTAASRH